VNIQPYFYKFLKVWTINLRQGFLGCMKNIRLNGINIEIAHMFHSTKLLPTERPTELSLSSKINKCNY